MAKITPMWLNSGISGRADRTSNTYTKVDRLTGRVYAVTLRNPRTGKDFNNAQITQNNKFGAISMGVGAWLRAAKAADASSEDKAQLEKFIKTLKAQHQYPNLMSLIVGKRYASVAADYSSVTIKDGNYTKTIEFTFNARPLVDAPEDPDFGGENGSSGSSGSSQGDSSNGAEQGEGNVTISLSAIGNGKVSIDGGTAGISKSKSVAPGTSVAILATPDSGATFTQWSDGNTEASRNVVVSAAMNLTATFSGGNAGGGDGPSE